MAKRPSFQFYPADWRKDTEVHACSFAARGLWIEMMCIMHESDAYGMLIVNQKAVDDQQLQRLVGGTPKVLAKLLKELEDNGVFSRTDDGVIYSRRMVRDEHIRTVRAAAGAKGAAVTNAARLPDDLPSGLPTKLPQQNWRQKSGSPSHARAQSSSSSSVNNSSSVSSSDSPDVAAAAPADPTRVTLPSIPGPTLDRDLESRRRTLRRQLEELEPAATGPPGNDD